MKMQVIHAWSCSEVPGEQLRAGFRDPDEKYPRLWIRRYAEDGQEIDFDLGFFAGPEQVLIFAGFIDRMAAQINRATGAHEFLPGLLGNPFFHTQESDDSDDEDDGEAGA